MKKRKRCRVCGKCPCSYRARRPNDAAEDLEFPPRPRAKSLKRQAAGRRSAEIRSERDEAVAVNLDAHELPAWDREKRRFKGTPEQRFAAFRQWVHDHPREVSGYLESEADDKLRKMIRERERARSVSVPCAHPWRFRTKELCKPNPRQKTRKAPHRKNPSKPPSEAARRLYKRLHWGIPPKHASQGVYVSTLAGPYAVLGVLKEIGYETQKGEPETFLFDHGFAGQRTLLVVNGLGELLIAKTTAKGGYTVNERGIVG